VSHSGDPSSGYAAFRMTCWGDTLNFILVSYIFLLFRFYLRMKSPEIERIKTLFATGFNEKTILTPLDKYTKSHMTSIKSAERYMVYSYAALPELLTKINELIDWDFNHNRVRYVMQDNGTLWFSIEARAGTPLEYKSKEKKSFGEQSPAHSEMMPSDAHAIAAGIIEFSEDHQRIEGISNYSGHYRPSVQTVVWPLAALMQHNADFADEVSLSFFWKNTRKKSKTIQLPKENLQDLLPSNGVWNYFNAGETPFFDTSSSTDTAIPSSLHKRNWSIETNQIFDSPKKIKESSSKSNHTDNDPFSDYDVRDNENEGDDKKNCNFK